jgi:hypothetical protein
MKTGNQQELSWILAGNEGIEKRGLSPVFCFPVPCFPVGNTPSNHCLQPFALNRIEQLQEKPAGMLIPDFPLLHGRYTGVQDGGENSLTEV